MATTDEVCELVIEDSDHEMEEYIFSGSGDELDAEVLKNWMLGGANVILGNDTDYSSDNDDDSYVGDYASKIGGNDSDRESNTSIDMNLQSSGSRGKGRSRGRGCGGHRSSRGGRGHGR